MSQPMFCGQCGAALRQGRRFCETCGAAVDDPGAVPIVDTFPGRGGQSAWRARHFVVGAVVLAVLGGYGLRGSSSPSSSPAVSSAPPVLSPTAPGDYVNEQDGSVMVNVPAGEFFMGASPKDKDAAGDQRGRTVQLPAYQIGKYEVTNAQYAKFVASAGSTGDNSWREYAGKWGDQAPVVCVSWDDADAYCRWAGLRLPGEAEWERAARGTDGRIYPWGDNWDASRAVCKTDGAKAVGSKPAGASPTGCLDMAGNVWEWTNDGSDPTQKNKVYRGGGWISGYPDIFRCSYRNKDPRDIRYNTLVGFRCARTP